MPAEMRPEVDGEKIGLLKRDCRAARVQGAGCREMIGLDLESPDLLGRVLGAEQAREKMAASAGWL